MLQVYREVRSFCKRSILDAAEAAAHPIHFSFRQNITTTTSTAQIHHCTWEGPRTLLSETWSQVFRSEEQLFGSEIDNRRCGASACVAGQMCFALTIIGYHAEMKMPSISYKYAYPKLIPWYPRNMVEFDYWEFSVEKRHWWHNIYYQCGSYRYVSGALSVVLRCMKTYKTSFNALKIDHEVNWRANTIPVAMLGLQKQFAFSSSGNMRGSGIGDW